MVIIYYKMTSLTSYQSRVPKLTLEDFQNIKNEGFNFELPQETINIIKKISELVGDASYIKTPVFKKKNNKRQHNVFDPNFKPTIFRVEKDEYQKNLSKIQEQINKISDKNYETIKNTTFEILDKIKEHMSEEDFEKIGQYIFTIASSNAFYSHLYAKLYSILMSKYEIFETIIEKSFIEYLEIFDEIKPSVNPDEDYGEFLKINTQNDKRRSLSKFITSLLNCDVIQSNFVLGILENLVNNFLKYIELENMITYCDETAENIKIIIVNSFNVFKKLEDEDEINIWLEITNKMNKISKMNTNNYKSLTKKTLFKFYDIIDNLKKN